MAAYVIAHARPSDLPHLAAIELAAARLLAAHAPDAVLNEVTPLPVFDAARADGRLWVALCENVPVGFAHVEMIEPGAPHLEELDVHPDHGRRGLGRWLVGEVCRWAVARGYATLTLTTFRDVPWNMPYYASLGFEEVAPEDLTSALRAVREDEERRGLDSARRVVMQYRGPST
jgi:GNAT superfamily N-acetyltransferase